MELPMILPRQVEYVIMRIMDSGGQAYLVGGALRDLMLGRTVEDYDIASSLSPDTIEELFKDYKTYPTGKRFGTITVVIDDLPMEITTFRGEDSYSDGRHPDKVTFVSDIETDLSRRDFTINSMAYNPYLRSDLSDPLQDRYGMAYNPYFSFNIIDPYQGRDDLINGIIRTVRVASERFQEDPLRMMRGIRFAAQLDFQLAKDTIDAIILYHPLLEKISAERIRDEFSKLLVSPNPHKGLFLFQSTGILKMIFKADELESPNTLSDKQLNIIKDCSLSIDYRLAVLLYFLFPKYEKDAAKTMLKDLRYDKATIAHVIKILNGYTIFISMEANLYNMRRLLGMVGLNDIYQLLNCYHTTFRILEDKIMEKKYTTTSLMLKKILENKDPVYFNELAITGDDVLRVGIGTSDKKLVGDALDAAYEWILQKPEMNDYGSLISKLLREYNIGI